MAIKYKKKKYQQHYVLYTVITAILLSIAFLAMVSHLYATAETDAYENLHVQTKQIKDDITLQLISDRENLATMANFAAKLYSDGESYDLMFESFKPIGLIANIGILNPDNTFVTKAGMMDLDGLISFEEEEQRGTYISGRVKDLTKEGNEIIRSAVPIKVNGETVGILYGVVRLDAIGERYNKMAQELDAQLFVYDKEAGELVIDTIHDKLGNISFLKEREYNEGFSYEQMRSTDKGFLSFESAYRDENMHLHYSTLEDIDWMIALARYDSQVFAEARTLTRNLFFVFAIMILCIGAYIVLLMVSERKTNAVITCASDIRKILLEMTENQNNITEALKKLCLFAKSRSTIFFNTDGEEYHYISEKNKDVRMPEQSEIYFRAELLRYAADVYQANGAAVNILYLKPNSKLMKTNATFYEFLKEHKIREVSFLATISRTNHITILAINNARNGNETRRLAEKVAACFSMALYNKNQLKRTHLMATTDGLTGTLNRVAYKTDLLMYDEEKDLDFSCIYIDVNELHICNNKYGHAAGDAMLIYIANTLKEVFYGHKVYRMGGDEFLVFCRNTDHDIVKKSIAIFLEQLIPRNYHVAVGMSYRTQNTNTEEMVREAEIRMYEEKSRYYQSKEDTSDIALEDNEYVQIKTGMVEVDTILSVIKENYNGIYRVSLDTDMARRILMPAYLKYNEEEEHFSQLFSQYVTETVAADYQRAVMNFLNYEALKNQLLEGKTPKITYKKNGDEDVVLSVHRLDSGDEENSDTLWIFAKA